MNIVANLRSSIEKIIATANAAPEPEEGEWPKQVVLGHLIDVDIEVWMTRIDLMVNAQKNDENSPQFAWWEPDPILTREKYGSFTFEMVQSVLIATRDRLITKYETLSAQEKRATAKHETFGELDIDGLMREVLIHDAEHANSFK